MNHAIVAEHLSKRFDAVEAVSDISFTVDKGEIFGFLGPNGAGKTTTINILTGLARPDSGRFAIDGIDCTERPAKARYTIGVVPDESNLYPELTGFDNLCFCAALYGISKSEREPRASELLERFGLKDAANRRFGGYSKGMKRKLTIAAGIIHNPEILFLDEPTTGIDVASARQLRQLIAELCTGGTTIFLTTHYIEEAERLCQRISFIVSGRIVKIDTVESLLQPFQDRHVLRVACESAPHGIEDQLAKRFPGLVFHRPRTETISIEAESPIPAGAIVHFLEEQNIEVFEARRIKPSLEDVFVRITGIEADAMSMNNKKGVGS